MSKIEWTDKSWNPVTGCTKISPGCLHCYAELNTLRFKRGPAFTERDHLVVMHGDRLDMPYKWKSPKKVFVNSMSDLFHDDVPEDFIIEVFDVMASNERHQFQVLTKRPERMREVVGRNIPHPSPNVWLGVSIENADYKWRVDELLQTPAAVHFLSCEPLIGDVGDLQLDRSCITRRPPPQMQTARVDWVIAGGESGPGARPMDPRWARFIRDQCYAHSVPFFFKQWGEHDEHGKRVGKGAAGRLLDGRLWDEYPAGSR